MSEEMLVEILKEPKNAILKQYQKLLALDEVKLEFNDDALHAIAKKALKKDTGARALRAIIEEFMLDIMYEIPKDDNIAKYGIFTMSETVLECVVNDYLTFIVLLFGLFCVAGNITIDGEFAGSPRINTALFVFGTLLSSVIGTTGSSMLLVRPFIKMNSWRKRKSHIMIFFIFLISNMGGCLTPIGDPPLLMGFMRGVPFFWSMKLFHILVFNMVILLVIFYFLDRRAYRKDIAEGRKPDIREPGTHFKIVGLHNLIYVAMIVGAVILSGTLPGMSAFQNADGTVKRTSYPWRSYTWIPVNN